MWNLPHSRVASLCLLIAGLLVVSGLLGQTVSGVVSGSVVDSTGLVVPGATVQLINENTGDSRTQTSNESGDFVFSTVLPGTYTVAVEALGFKRVERRNLNVTGAERLRARPFVMEVGSMTESITVTAEGTPVQTGSAERSAVVTSDQMAALMSKGRVFLTLLRVLPGIQPNGDPYSIRVTMFPNVQGLRNSYSTVSMDGASVNDLGDMRTMGAPTNMDAISEVKVLMSNYRAEYGRTAGAMINAVTKSGSKQFHGTGYYYKRHEEFNANYFFNNLNGVPKPRYRYDTWGGTIGGPVILPGFNKNRDKLFFFFSEEYLPSKFPFALVRATVPTAAELNGDFSQTLDTGNRLVVIKDPTTGQPFAGNKIPADRINHNGQVLLGAFPDPNHTDRAISGGNYNYTFQELRRQKQTNEVFRTDYNATNNIRMFFRGSVYRAPQVGHIGAMAAWGMLETAFKYSTDTGTFHVIYNISPTMVNEFSASGHHVVQQASPNNPADVRKLSRTALGYNQPQLYPGLNPLDLIPLASFGGVPNGASFSGDRRYPLKRADNVFDFTDNLTKIHGGHTMKAGIFVERVRYNGAAQGLNFGTFDFARDANNPLDSNYAYSNALLGNFKSYQESSTRIAPIGRGTTLEWFLQDSWRATKKLTLDLGVRFSRYTPYAQKDGNAAGFIPQEYDLGNSPRLYYPALNAAGKRVAFDQVTGEYAPALLIGAFVPGTGDPANGMVVDDGTRYPRGLMEPQGVLPAPRIGFAYDLTGDGKTAIRGGFGITYNTRERVLLLDINQVPPVQYNPTIYYGSIDALTESAGTLFPSSSAGLALNGNAPSVYSMSFGIQRDIGFHTVLDVAYVGNLGRHLLQAHNINRLPYGELFKPEHKDPTSSSGAPLAGVYFRPYPGYTELWIDEHGSSSNYNSLQVQANRRFSRGLQFAVAWTWSHSLDYASNDWGSVAHYVDRREWDYGPSDFDVTHTATVTWLWDIPKATRLVSNRVVGAVFDNWRLSGVATFSTGRPTGVSFSTVDGADLTGGGDGIRIVMNGDPRLPKSERTFDQWFDTSAFARPEKGTIGNSQRNPLRKPGTNNFDLSFFKEVPVTERARFQLRWEMYNAFNHTQFSGYNTSARFDAAGNQISATFGRVNSAAGARTMQGSLRFMF